MGAGRQLTLLSWNIQVGSDSWLFGNGWSRRKSKVIETLLRYTPDLICVQEATACQLLYLASALPGYSYIGVGRDDGMTAGEHCAIFYNKNIVAPTQSGTFWLSETPESSANTWDFPFKRICTWATFAFAGGPRDESFFLFNTHFPLNPFAQNKAALLLVERLELIAGSRKSLLAGDFNSTPCSNTWSHFLQSGLLHCKDAIETPREPATQGRHAPTQTLFGIRTFCIDAVFATPDMKINVYEVLEAKVSGPQPSDHLALLVSFDTAHDAPTSNDGPRVARK